MTEDIWDSENTTGKFNPQRAAQIENQKTIDDQQVTQAREQSIQSRATDDSVGGRGIDSFIGTHMALLSQSTETIPPWWSPGRDLALSAMWKASNLMSGAMYMMAAKIATIPWHVEPIDRSIDRHVKDAEMYQKRIYETANYGQGWGAFIKQQVQSLLGTDNGRFMEIIDLSSNKNGPIVGPVISVAHLDPHRCTRVSDPEFPIIYQNISGDLHRLHYTRVAYESQLPSEHAKMYSVGFCAVSRATHYAQHMLDIARYKEEKLGSRPMRGVMLVGGGLDPEAIGQAFAMARGMSDDANLQRYSAIPVVGNAEFDNPTLELVTVSSLPDGFNEEEATIIAMSAISLAWGVDARELWPTSSSSSRADTLVSHIKQRGKGPGDIIQETERMFNTFVLPNYLKFVFDYQDDAQDRQVAEINTSRSKKRTVDLESSVSDIRTEREIMLTNGELNQPQFNALELKDGRRPNGMPLETIFFDETPILVEILTLPNISDPLDVRGNDIEVVLDSISKQIPIALEKIGNEKRERQKELAEQALAALQFLSDTYVANKLPTGLADSGMVDPVAEEEKRDRPPKSALPGDVDDEQNMATLENNPRELSEKMIVPHNENRLKAQQLLMEELFKPEPTVIEFSPNIIVEPPNITVNVPETIVNIEPPDVIVPNIEIPTINIPEIKIPTIEIPAINVPESIINIHQIENTKESDNYEVIDLHRDNMGQITSLTRRKKEKSNEQQEK